MIRFILSVVAFGCSAATQAAPPMELRSTVVVERITIDAAGKPQVRLEEPKVVTPGDRLRFTLTYHNRSSAPAADFVVTNPIPTAVAFAGYETEGALLSVDGGKSWGALAELRVLENGKARAASPADVTHIKWKFAAPISAGNTGNLSFRGVVK